jgi:DNA-binding transcriptional regulator YiaG
MLMRQVREPILIGVMLAGFGTSSECTFSTEVGMYSPLFANQTTAGASIVIAQSAGAAIAELRRLSGFTWDQLARLFSVSRRSLHFWASGKSMTPSNEEHLQRLLAVIRKIDRGSASANRSLLLAVREDGTIPFDLLAAERYDRVVSLVGVGEGRRVQVPKLSEKAMLERAPRLPEEMVDALQDRVHRETGISRPAKSVRVRSGS